MNRRNSKKVRVGSIWMGGDTPISVQSMTTTDTADVKETLKQIKALSIAGADIVRVSVYNKQCAAAVRQLVDQSPVPLVADIHFDPELALLSMENGIHKLRLNPGNIQRREDVERVVACAKAHKVPIRIGVNSGSVPRDLIERFGLSSKALVEAALRHVKILEDLSFQDIVISLKASDVELTVCATRQLAKRCEYPLHLGITEAGTEGMGNIKSSIGIGSLLLDGIGDTIRVSLSGSPLPEPEAGIGILRALGLRKDRVNIVACPTCGRCTLDVGGIARAVEDRLKDEKLPYTVAIMGCVVNGPEEARRADIGIAGGGREGVLFKKGKFIRRVENATLVDELIDEIYRMKSGIVDE